MVKDGETIHGTLTSKPTKQNKRDLDVTIDYRLETDDTSRITQGRCEYKM